MPDASQYVGHAAVILMLTAHMASAGPQACGTAHEPSEKAAIAAAEARFAIHWRQSASGWSTRYEFKPEPKNPFGISPFRVQQGEPATTTGDSRPFGGIASIDAVDCSYYELQPETGFVVRFVGRGLRFSENGSKPSRPIRQALVAVSIVRSQPTPVGTVELLPLPEARTALDPDLILSLPPIAAPRAPVAPKRR